MHKVHFILTRLDFFSIELGQIALEVSLTHFQFEFIELRLVYLLCEKFKFGIQFIFERFVLVVIVQSGFVLGVDFFAFNSKFFFNLYFRFNFLGEFDGGGEVFVLVFKLTVVFMELSEFDFKVIHVVALVLVHLVHHSISQGINLIVY